ncbi:MAG: glycosyltransferase family 39 protein [Elusimicrobia bacterium]|nr:glycosyltransferase family 39 protein [Elusimicrobiota bacterium]
MLIPGLVFKTTKPPSMLQLTDNFFSSRRAFLLMIATALVVRTAVFFTARKIDYGISTGFKLAEVARNINEGRGLVMDPLYLKILNEEYIKPDPMRPRLELFEEIPSSAHDASRLEPFQGRPPGYSFILALTWKIFGHKKFVYSQFLFCLLDLLAALITWWLGRELFGPRAGLLGGFIYALSLPHATLSIVTTHDAQGAFPLLAGAGLFWYGLKNKSLAAMVSSGLVAGIASLVRQEPFFLPFILGSSLIFTRSLAKTIKTTLMMQAMALLVVLFWGLRNYERFGKLTLFSPTYGANLLVGLADYPNKWGLEPSEEWLKKYIRDKGVTYPKTSVEFNKACIQEFFKFVRADPFWYFSVVLKRTLTSLMPTLMPFEKTYTRYYRQLLGKTGKFDYAQEYPIEFIVPIMYKFLWLILWFAGMAAFRNFTEEYSPETKNMMVALAGITLYYLLSHVPMHCEFRFLLPGYFPLIILGSQGIVQCLQSIKKFSSTVV